MEFNDDSHSRGGISTRSSSSKAEPVSKSGSTSMPSNSVGSEPISAQSLTKFQKGDLYWSRIGAYPYWPCMVSPDPENQEISSHLNHFGKSYEACHVRFFGDKGSRAWVKKSKLISYEGRSDFDDKVASAKDKSFKKLHRKGLKNKCWHTAIEEADLMNICRPEERIMKFENILDSSRKPLKKTKKASRKTRKLGS